VVFPVCISASDPDRVKTRTPGRQCMNFSRFSAFSAITGSAKRKDSLQMRRFQTISEFSHSLDPLRTLGRWQARSWRSWTPLQRRASKVGMHVDLRRFDRLMPEPECDHGLIDAILKQLHRGAVPQDMRAHSLPDERGARRYVRWKRLHGRYQRGEFFRQRRTTPLTSGASWILSRNVINLLGFGSLMASFSFHSSQPRLYSIPQVCHTSVPVALKSNQRHFIHSVNLSCRTNR